MFETTLFFAFALASVTSAILVITQRNAVASAVYLIVTFLSLAGIYLLLLAPFIAVIQVLVYAGAIMVLFLFVIMLLNLAEEKIQAGRFRLGKIAGVILGVVLLAQFCIAYASIMLSRPETGTAAARITDGNTESIARLLFTTYLLPFEITSILLLAAMIGAVILAKREV